jgi:hypothetical protein
LKNAPQAAVNRWPAALFSIDSDPFDHILQQETERRQHNDTMVGQLIGSTSSPRSTSATISLRALVVERPLAAPLAEYSAAQGVASARVPCPLRRIAPQFQYSPSA